MDLPTSSCLPWSSLSTLKASSLMPRTPSQLASSESSEKASTQLRLREPLTSYVPSNNKLSAPEQRPSSRRSSSSMSSTMIDSIPSCFNSLLTPPDNPTKDRLCLWIPTSPSTRISPSPSNTITETMLDHILEVIGALWTGSTKELYGTSLLIFHVHCDMYNVPELEHCPVSHTILLAFLSSCAGAYSRSTISNFTAGIRAWHLLHGHPWVAEQYELKITCLTPRSSKWPKCPPMTLNNIKTIQTFLNLDDPCDVAIYTCMVIVFYSVARLGKFTVMATTKFDPSKHITSQNKQPYKDTSTSTQPHPAPTSLLGSTQRAVFDKHRKLVEVG
ncbi:hypothetical protein V8E55_005715 [Tylopilus felleus]